MSRIDEINAILDDLGDTPNDAVLELALRDYGTREVLEVVADRAAGSGGISLARSGTLSLPDDASVLLFGTELASIGTVVIRCWIVIDWDFDGSTWLNTGASATGRFQLILQDAQPEGVDIVTYDLINDQPSGSGAMVEFSPLNLADQGFANSLRSAVTTRPNSVINCVAAPDAASWTGNFEVFMLWAAPA